MYPPGDKIPEPEVSLEPPKDKASVHPEVNPEREKLMLRPEVNPEVDKTLAHPEVNPERDKIGLEGSEIWGVCKHELSTQPLDFLRPLIVNSQ